jgi:hypothetical protein
MTKVKVKFMYIRAARNTSVQGQLVLWIDDNLRGGSREICRSFRLFDFLVPSQDNSLTLSGDTAQDQLLWADVASASRKTLAEHPLAGPNWARRRTEARP